MACARVAAGQYQRHLSCQADHIDHHTVREIYEAAVRDHSGVHTKWCERDAEDGAENEVKRCDGGSRGVDNGGEQCDVDGGVNADADGHDEEI